jgi:hypothetical protein
MPPRNFAQVINHPVSNALSYARGDGKRSIHKCTAFHAPASAGRLVMSDTGHENIIHLHLQRAASRENIAAVLRDVADPVGNAAPPPHAA